MRAQHRTSKTRSHLESPKHTHSAGAVRAGVRWSAVCPAKRRAAAAGRARDGGRSGCVAASRGSRAVGSRREWRCGEWWCCRERRCGECCREWRGGRGRRCPILGCRIFGRCRGHFPGCSQRGGAGCGNSRGTTGIAATNRRPAALHHRVLCPAEELRDAGRARPRHPGHLGRCARRHGRRASSPRTALGRRRHRSRRRGPCPGSLRAAHRTR